MCSRHWTRPANFFVEVRSSLVISIILLKLLVVSVSSQSFCKDVVLSAHLARATLFGKITTVKSSMSSQPGNLELVGLAGVVFGKCLIRRVQLCLDVLVGLLEADL